MNVQQQATSEEATLQVSLSGFDLINSPRLNKGTAFTDRERDIFHLHGLLPPHVGTLDEQVERRMQGLNDQSTPFNKYAFLRDLQDSNETIFYALLVRNVEKMLPLVYTPTVGEGCQRFSEIWRKPRGLFLSYPNKDRITQILSHPRYDGIKCIVVSDGERILGLGDQGAGGMGIPIGKMALYTALGGIHPEHCLPILLDVGTDNEERLSSPIYVGWKHHRIRGQEYDDFVDTFVSAVKARWPHVLLQWEDFAGSNAARFLARYRDQLCTFNDDIQGTAAIAAATLISAINVTGIPLKQQKIVVVGFGTAGLGITNLLAQFIEDEGVSPDEARQCFYAIDRYGLVTEHGKDVRPEQMPYARKEQEVQGWSSQNGEITLLDVVRNAKPTVLIGVSGQAGAFTEQAVREMAKHTARPVIFPLSNPTSRSEAIPQDLINWTEGRALVGTGSPFDPVDVDGKKVPIAQTNNSYIFPGLALGIVASKARRVTDAMVKAAATELIRHVPTQKDKLASLLPPISEARALGRLIAQAVGKQAILDGQAQISDEDALRRELDANIWEPAYVPYELQRGAAS
ncbi:NAD-dependent malic enzyme [Acidisarcina polymorpha]|uniref:NAD-dependent malic enzyme n=1 Tax=Acidisarcina polymorpha TaxID=2211140 RepID=A0A2Z5FSE4_9BACT|nr:NAD-dependent malic enzyme [Acidisarcina polymorpha]AXC09761.1 NAD-dependent malic enzyme [Acidisarcina polymorpha]